MGILTIIPPPAEECSGLTRTQGTKLLVDGQELKGVTRVVLVAEVGDVWRARIECMAHVQAMPGMWVEVHEGVQLTWWRRLLLRLVGVSVDTADLGSAAHTYEKP